MNKKKIKMNVEFIFKLNLFGCGKIEISYKILYL